MAQPSDLLRQHAARGRKLHSDLLMTRQSKLSVDSDISAGIDALDMFFDISGKKRLAKGLGKRFAHSSVNTNLGELTRRADEWISESKDILGGVSLVSRGIPSKPNSETLVRSFSSEARYAKPETRLSHGIRYLERLADKRLILNDEITQTKIAIEEALQFPSAPPSGIESGLNELKGLVSPFPAVAEALNGAVAVCRSKTPDWGRQAIGSMRNALETLVRTLSSENDWRTGLSKILPSESTRKQITVTYSMLCAKGPHSQEIPSEEDVLFCIRLTQEVIRHVLTQCGGDQNTE